VIGDVRRDGYSHGPSSRFLSPVSPSAIHPVYRRVKASDALSQQASWAL